MHRQSTTASHRLAALRICCFMLFLPPVFLTPTEKADISVHVIYKKGVFQGLFPPENPENRAKTRRNLCKNL